MPALTFAGGALQLVYYDLRDDDTYLQYVSCANPPGGGSYSTTGTRVLAGDRVDHPEQVFWQEIKDTAPDGGPLLRRHTVDVRGAQASPGPSPTFTSWPISQYAFGVTDVDIEQVQFNPPNLPLYAHGTTPFFGDYIDVAGVSFVPTSNGGWAFNTDLAGPQVFHAVWTDNRDVRPPTGSKTWADYTPPNVSLNWPVNPALPCVPGTGNTTGMRDANVYSVRDRAAACSDIARKRQGARDRLPRAPSRWLCTTTRTPTSAIG